MSASQSNLSDPRFRYDLVVAVTQKSINATMKQLLANVASPEVVCCYVYNTNNILVPIDYTTLKSNANNSDPFEVPANANPATNQDLINLTNASFAGAVKAQIGLPDLPLAQIPAVVTLGAGTSVPVLFNLLCSEFQITGFDYGPRSKVSWINQSQPDGQTWYFSSNVTLNSTAAKPQSVPPAVQQRIQQLNNSVGPGAFSIQQLFLDLDTAIVNTTPTIVGIPPGWPVWSLIETVFLGAYFAQLKQSGQPVLGYTVALNNPAPATLQLGALSDECSPLTNNGQPISNPTPAQLDATTFIYLGTTSTTPPTAVTFPWNWVELGEAGSFSGVQSVRRDIFLNFFAGLLNSEVGRLCMDTSVTMSSKNGSGFNIAYSCSPSGTPGSFQLSTVVAPAATDGFSQVMSLNFSKTANGSASVPVIASINGNFNYTLTGSVAINTNQIRIQITAQAYMEFDHHEVGVAYIDLGGANYYDKTLTVTYTLEVSQNGQLVVTQTNSLADNSTPWNFTSKGLAGFSDGDLKNGLAAVETNLATYLDNAFTSYVSEVTDEINGYQGWVFPGADSFVFKNLSFSSGQDLVSQLTYANPD